MQTNANSLSNKAAQNKITKPPQANIMKLNEILEQRAKVLQELQPTRARKPDTSNANTAQSPAPVATPTPLLLPTLIAKKYNGFDTQIECIKEHKPFALLKSSAPYFKKGLVSTGFQMLLITGISLVVAYFAQSSKLKALSRGIKLGLASGIASSLIFQYLINGDKINERADKETDKMCREDS